METLFHIKKIVHIKFRVETRIHAVLMTSFADTSKAALWNSKFMFVFGSIQSDNSAVAASFVFTCSHVPILRLCST